MSPLAFAWRGLTRQPARAILAIIGIAAVGALLFDMLLLSRGLVLSMQRIFESADYDIRVASSEALPGMGPSLENRSNILSGLEALPEIEHAVALSFASAVIVDRDTKETRSVSLTGNEPPGRGFWTLLEGQPLGGVDEAGRHPLLINRVLAERDNLELGATVLIRDGRMDRLQGRPLAFRVDGVVEMPFNSRFESSGVTTMNGFYRAFGADDPERADLFLVASERASGTNAAMEAILAHDPALHVFSTSQLVARFQATEFSYFRQIAFVLSSITICFAFLLVTTLLTVSVNQRFAEIATLRALGFPRRRVVLDLLCESGLMVGTGALLALPLGALMATWLDSILRSIPGLPAKLHFFVYEPRALILFSVLMFVTGVLAALYPTFLAARLPIAQTLRNEVVS